MTAPHGTNGSIGLVPGAARIVLALTTLHVVRVGYGSWGDRSGWPGTLPPIATPSFLLSVAFLVRRMRRNGGVGKG